MNRSIQFSLKGLFILTLNAPLGAAFVHYDRLAKIADAQEMVMFRKKVLDRLIQFRKSGEFCDFPGLVHDKQVELRNAQKRLEELRGH